MVDIFLLLVQPNAGDELQGIKRGILEFADLVVVNKCDGEMVSAAQRAEAQYQGALRLFPSRNGWEPLALCCSALERHRVDEVWRQAERFLAAQNASGELARRRAAQNAG
jgi:LAO/AO transport system kinase